MFFHFVNLCLFLTALGLLFFITRRLAGQLAATVTVAFVAIHYAVDIPVRWVSGSQDLLALAGALLAVWLVVVGRAWLAALAFFLALLCKETVALTPIVAILIQRAQRRSWREALLSTWPLLLATIPWVVLWLTFGSRQVTEDVRLTVSAGGFLATIVQLARVASGLEWPTGGFGLHWAVAPPFLALLPVVVAIVLAKGSRAGSRCSPLVGLGWAFAAALPVTLVSTIWSAYYYLFAVAGIGLALGTWASRLPRWAAVALILFSAWTSQTARHINEFSSKPDAWSAQSHVNNWYFGRATTVIKHYLRNLKQARPTVPHASTFYFFNIPAFTTWQAVDGPLIRWAYRDSSLRSYWLSDFSLDKARRGPSFFFMGREGRLVETMKGEEGLNSLAMSMVLKNNLEGARDVLLFQLESKPGARVPSYWLSWVEWALGQTSTAIELLHEVGLSARAGPTPALSKAEAMARSGATGEAIRLLSAATASHVLDPAAHAFLADLLLATKSDSYDGIMSAFAARVLEPGNPQAWRRWGLIQYRARLFPQADESLKQYVLLGGTAAKQDREVQEILDKIPDLLPGGEQVQRDLRRQPLTGAW